MIISRERLLNDISCCIKQGMDSCNGCSHKEGLEKGCVENLLKDAYNYIISECLIQEMKEAKENNSRKDILELAEKCVCGQREEDYGTPEDSFGLIAELWTPVIKSCVTEGADVCVQPETVALMMALLKVARLIKSPEHLDSWVDLAGYAACGGEIAGGGHEA